MLLLEKNRSLQSENAALRISNSDLSSRLISSRGNSAPTKGSRKRKANRESGQVHGGRHRAMGDESLD